MKTIHTHLPLRDLSPPRPDQVELWLTRCGSLPLAGPLPSALEPRKQQRLQRRFLLRLLLGAYLGRPGRDVRLVRNARGKPRLAPELAATGLRFSLSHSGDWLLVAVGSGASLGVDLEVPRTMRRATDIARRYFCAAESRRLESLARPERERAFLRLWTAKEAMVKAAGTGLAGYLDRVEIALDRCPALVGVPADWPSPGHWSLRELALPDGLCGHLAVPSPGVKCVLHHLVDPEYERT